MTRNELKKLINECIEEQSREDLTGLELLSSVIKKFENDAKLKKMYAELELLVNPAERRMKHIAIALYIKSKLTPQEFEIFAKSISNRN